MNVHRKTALLRRTITLLLIVIVFTLTSCESKKIKTQKLLEEINGFITEISENGELSAIEDRWFSSNESSPALDFSVLTGENGTLIFGTKTTVPFSYKVGDGYCGIVPDLVLQFCQKYGYKAEFMDFSDTNSMVLAVSSGKCDFGGSNTSVTEERGKMVDFSEPIFLNSGVVAINREDNDSYTDLSYLDGKNLGVVTGTVYHEIISETVKDAVVFEYNSPADLCQALSSKKVDAIVHDYGVLRYALPNYESEIIVDTLVEDDRFALIFPKDGVGTDGIVKKLAESFRRTLIQDARWKQVLKGIETTLLITVVSILAGTALGFGLCMAYRKNNKAIIWLIDAFSWLIRGLPTVVLLLIMYYVIFGTLSVSGTIVSIISFTMIFAVTVCGHLQSGIRAVDRGQFEACTALGYKERDGFRKIILPQVIRFSLPGYKTEIIALIKATSIVGYIAVQDLTKTGDIIRSATYEAFAPLILTAIIYFFLAWLLTKVVDIFQSIAEKNTTLDHYLKGVERNA